MPDEFLPEFNAKCQEIGTEMQIFADMSVQFSALSADPKQSVKALLMMLRTGKQARKLADKLFEYSELLEKLEDMETDA